MTRSNGSLVPRTGQKIDQREPQTQCGQRVSSRSFLPQRHLHTAVPRVRHRRLQGSPVGCEIFCSVRNLTVCLRKRCDAAAARSDPGQEAEAAVKTCRRRAVSSGLLLSSCRPPWGSFLARLCLSHPRSWARFLLAVSTSRCLHPVQSACERRAVTAPLLTQTRSRWISAETGGGAAAFKAIGNNGFALRVAAEKTLAYNSQPVFTHKVLQTLNTQ